MIKQNVLGADGLKSREKDFVFQFEKNWKLLQDILKILRMIKKEDGTDLTYYTATRVGDLNIQDVEGAASVDTDYKITPAGTYKIKLERAQKTVTAEAVLNYGVEMALARTDQEFMSDLQYEVQDRLYKFLKLGTLKSTRPTFLGAIAASKGVLLNRASALHISIGEIVGFVGIMDLYNYLGEQTVTVQQAFGLSYIQNFLGYSVLFLLPDSILDGEVISTPMNNLIGYYVDPSDAALTSLGLQYTTTGETNLIGVSMKPDYDHATGTTYAILGLTLFAERIDLVSLTTITEGADSKGKATVESASNMATGSPATGISDGKRKPKSE